MEQLEFDDIQGLVFSGYGKKMQFACYSLLRIGNPEAARRWLRQMVDESRITPGIEDNSKEWCLNIAFTAPGLSELGLGNEDLEKFDVAFREGMTKDRRSKYLLGDIETSAPKKWDWGYQKTIPHCILMIYASNDTIKLEREEIERSAYQQNDLSLVKSLYSSPPAKHTNGTFPREHFGFVDGISQPIIRGTKQASRIQDSTNQHLVAAGEFILGYTNEYNRITEIPRISAAKDRRNLLSLNNNDNTLSDFGRNGTYLVFRQLKQNVSGFWNFVRNATNDELSQERLAAKMVGRWPSGALMTDGAQHDPGEPFHNGHNDFNYADFDAHGYGCPQGSHIRRVNPRGVGLGESVKRSLQVARRHRLLRRGRSYGPSVTDRYADSDSNTERGLFFLCLNSNIERQFEFVQHSWVNNVKFAGLDDDRDPLIGAVKKNENGSMTIPGRPVRERIKGIGRYVTVKGGAYFFMPGIKALRCLSAL